MSNSTGEDLYKDAQLLKCLATHVFLWRENYRAETARKYDIDAPTIQQFMQNQRFLAHKIERFPDEVKQAAQYIFTALEQDLSDEGFNK